ncbi:uncharacterized protein LOC115444864 [Manduca sexta]|uniref:uncharacterized protein LOC115444864 n=1 Tax=Manduca sexta TaxID=7130 RepID=UPI00188EBB71|nr:uncharacterized protein LOC115444864 [Manduca sexta]
MGDGLKITKDKRHRSSSSLAGAAVEGTRSERKIDIRASIPEVDDQFATAEARCDDLQEKIDLVKTLKRKRKLKKRSMTTVIDQAADHDNVPFITVRTQPKKTLVVTEVSQAARLRAFQLPQNPTRGYLDPATVEQRRMIGQVRGYHQMYRRPQDTAPNIIHNKQGRDHRSKQHRKVRPDGDSEFGASGQVSSDGPMEVACGRDDTRMLRHRYIRPAHRRMPSSLRAGGTSSSLQADDYSKETRAPGRAPQRWRGELNGEMKAVDLSNANRRRTVTVCLAMYSPNMESAASKQATSMPLAPGVRRQIKTAENGPRPREERPVVELFNKHRGNANSHRSPPPIDAKIKKPKVCRPELNGDAVTGPIEPEMHLDSKKENHSQPRRGKYRSRRYEMPTIASQMKQAGTRCYYGNANKTNIPFIVSKSTTPSHNIGVNLQQVLNGIKTQQPLTGIPMTIAYHMGMGHVPSYGAKSATTRPTLENREINTIKVGQRLLRLPSYKYISYDRLLNLYREGDGIVSKFLRANSRPHYFYTSMYNLVTNREDFDGATSKGRSGSQEAKQSLAEYASLYREYEQIGACIKKGNYDPELEQRREELSRELAAREDHIRKVVQDYRTSCDVDRWTLRASVSTAEDGYRHSTSKLNFGEPHQ